MKWRTVYKQHHSHQCSAWNHHIHNVGRNVPRYTYTLHTHMFHWLCIYDCWFPVIDKQMTFTPSTTKLKTHQFHKSFPPQTTYPSIGPTGYFTDLSLLSVFWFYFTSFITTHEYDTVILSVASVCVPVCPVLVLKAFAYNFIYGTQVHLQNI